MDINERVRALTETRNRVWNEAKNWLEGLPKGEEMSAEQRSQWDRYNERIDGIQSEVDSMVDAELRNREAGQLREAQSQAFGTEPADAKERVNINAELRSWMRGEATREARDYDGKPVNGVEVNLRAVERERQLLRLGASPDEIRALAWDTGSVASAVPTLLDRSLYEVLEAEIAGFRMPFRRFTTESGAPMDFPKVTAHAIATQVAGQGTTLAGTDPTFGKISLTPAKYAELIKISNEVVTDNAVDIVSWVAGDIGRAVGRRVNEAVISSLVAEAFTGAAGTVATGGSLLTPDYDDLVNLQYSVNDAYRNAMSAAWLARDSTAGTLRKLRDGAGGTEGAVLWQPSTQVGISGQRQPDQLLGRSFYTDPNVASMASNAKILFFGDWNSYYFRLVGNLMVERNDSVGFATDEAFFRGKWRAASDAQDLTAINLMKQSV
jgi:HK97 family phage major capsid protein